MICSLPLSLRGQAGAHAEGTDHLLVQSFPWRVSKPGPVRLPFDPRDVLSNHVLDNEVLTVVMKSDKSGLADAVA